ncbi:fibronectin type III domain-containing protein [Amnibacterium kyonggiense]|uniref:Fibronectin type III domain protein n=1 Tax=Amnibacterium kyonggiense TaxID=595671 RepID=A0A4R7FIR5_9MICO|nr:fibronectin type III domain-containing protein [Amnibacterium kyonggiense]TDS74978.1 fibronectin type III domain protein [Amnibacterium kyonggiense]
MRPARRPALITAVVVALLGGGLVTAPAEAAPITAPAVAAPSRLAVQTRSEAIDLTWRASTTAAVTAYSVRYRAKGASGWSAARTTAASPFRLAPLLNGTRYELQVRAETATASSAWSAAVTGVPGRVAGPVADLEVLRVASNDAVARWDRPADTGGRTITRYDLRVRSSASAAWHGARSVTATTASLRGFRPSSQLEVRAVSSRGAGAWSAPTSPIVTRSAVAAPTAFSAKAVRGGVALSWSASTTSGTTAYVVRSRKVGSTAWAAQVVTGRSVVVTGLAAGKSSRFAVAARTAAGIGRFSATATAAPDRVPVASPRSPRATAGDASVVLAWSKPAAGRVKTYQWEYRAVGTARWHRSTRTSRTTATVRGLKNGVAYVFAVRASGAHSGPWSATVRATPVARPAAPTAVTAELRSATSALDLTWAAPRTGPTPTAWDVRYRGANATGWTTVTTAAAAPATTLAGLPAGAAYRIQVRGRTAVGGGAWSAPASAYVPVFSLPVVDLATSAPITNTDDYVASTVSIASKTDPTQDFTGTAGIKGHGNSTWPLPKKPYKIKLDAKAGLLGMATNKHWVLLADYKDRTHLRNDVALYLGKQTSMAWTPDSRFVELVLNGRYEGLYELAEQVRVDADRVNIDALSSKDTSATKITGGYLLERDGNRDLATEVGFDTTHGEPITVKDPETPTAAQLQYIQQYVDDFETALYSGGDYRQYIDLDSFVDWYIVEELVENSDAWFSSAFFTKPRGGKLTMGPLWDFDLSTMDYGVTKGKSTSWYVRNLGWWAQLAKDPVFEQRVAERWQVLKPKFDTVWTRIATQRAAIATAAAQDGQLWGYTTHDAHVTAMSTFLRTREAWLNQQWTAPATR